MWGRVCKAIGREDMISDPRFATNADRLANVVELDAAIGDLDGDGEPDLAVVNNGSNTVSVFRNTSTSGSVSFASKVDFTTGTSPYSIAIGDLDGDGKADIMSPYDAVPSAAGYLCRFGANRGPEDDDEFEGLPEHFDVSAHGRIAAEDAADRYHKSDDDIHIART